MVNKKDDWERRIALLALHKFEKVNMPTSTMDTLLRELDSDNLRIVRFEPPNSVVFETKDCEYNLMGERLEQWLFRHFKLRPAPSSVPIKKAVEDGN